MRTFIIVLTVFLIGLTPVYAAGDKCCDISIKKDICFIGDYDFDVENGNVYLYPDNRRHDEIRITDDSRLYINGREIDLDDDQRELVNEIHSLAINLENQAHDIALQGAKIGAAGAQIGIHAVAGIFKLIRSDYDSEDLESELEYKAERLEEQAEKLEELAEALEDDADELERQIEKMEREFSEIREL